jgi:PhnB protein
MSLSVYLNFNGNCKEAMTFYKKCLGGKLFIQRIGDISTSEKMPQKMKDFILHSTLINKDLIIMATDIGTDEDLKKGNSISLMLNCKSEKEIKLYFEKLSDGGQKSKPIAVSQWGALVGNLTDKFGNQWLLYYSKSAFKNN